MNQPTSSEARGEAALRTRPLARCPICSSARARFLFALGDRVHGTPGEYAYRRCEACSSVYQDPQIVSEDLARCYPRQYFTHAAPPSPPAASGDLSEPSSTGARRVRDMLRIAIQAAVKKTPVPGFRGRVGRLLARSRGLRARAFYGLIADELFPGDAMSRRALEIGCGNGERLRGLKQIWDIEGVEWDPAAAGIARSASGCQIWEGDFSHVQLPGEQYGLIFLHHVVEHFPDPIDALRHIGELLAPRGRAVLVYPNPQALGAELFGRDWYPWEAPRHLVLPSVRGFVAAARTLGLHPIRCETNNRYAEFYYAHSRSYRKGTSIDELHPRVLWRDRLLGLLGRLILGVGMAKGEDVLLILEKRSGAH